jgi:hypothetical protein
MMMIVEQLVERVIGRETEVAGVQPAPVPLWPPHIPHLT